MSADGELLEAWRGGDREAGSRLLRAHFGTLTLFFRNKVPEAAQADLIQLTMLGAVKSHDRVPDNLPFRVYLLGIARRVLADWYRKRDRSTRGRAVLERVVAAPVESPSAPITQRDEERVLLEALRRLTLDLQIAVELFYWEEMSIEDIGLILEIPKGTVKSRLRRARESLLKQVQIVADTPALCESTLQNLDGWAEGLKARMQAANADDG